MKKKIIAKKRSKREKRREKRTLECMQCGTHVEPHRESDDYCIPCTRYYNSLSFADKRSIFMTEVMTPFRNRILKDREEARKRKAKREQREKYDRTKDY